MQGDSGGNGAVSHDTKEALSSAEQFLRTLHASFSAPPVSDGALKLGGFVMFSRGGMTVTLDGEEAKRYQKVREQLFDCLPAPRQAMIGRRTRCCTKLSPRFDSGRNDARRPSGDSRASA